MSVNVQASQIPSLMDVEEITTIAPVRVKLHLKNGSTRTENADMLLTRLLKMVQQLVQKDTQ